MMPFAFLFTKARLAAIMEETRIGGTDMDRGRVGLALPHVDPNNIENVDLDTAKKTVSAVFDR